MLISVGNMQIETQNKTYSLRSVFQRSQNHSCTNDVQYKMNAVRSFAISTASTSVFTKPKPKPQKQPKISIGELMTQQCLPSALHGCD